MPPLRITPWQRAEEVLEVRSLFFSRHGHGGELSANAEDLALACDIVSFSTVSGFHSFSCSTSTSTSYKYKWWASTAVAT